MKRFFTVFVLVLFAVMTLQAEDFIVKNIRGKAKVRHGVMETWTYVSVGDTLKPEDTILTERSSTLVIVKPAGVRFSIPEATMLDIADLRNLTQDELLLRLAMENIQSVPSQKRSNDLTVPNTTIVHGNDISKDAEALKLPRTEVGSLQMNGVEVLYSNSLYASGILKSKSLMRLFPEARDEFAFRIQLAKAFEQVNLYDEALTEYVSLSQEQLSKDQKTKLDKTIQLLKNRRDQ
jgi:hypothetical protein